MGRLNTGHVSACARELDLTDLPDSGLAEKENHLSKVHLGTFQTLLPNNLFFFFPGEGLQKKGCDPNNRMLTHYAEASPKLRTILLG